MDRISLISARFVHGRVLVFARNVEDIATKRTRVSRTSDPQSAPLLDQNDATIRAFSSQLRLSGDFTF